MKTRDFKTIDTVTIAGQRGDLKEHKDIAWYRFRGHNVNAKSKEEAIEKFEKSAQAVRGMR